MLKPDARDLSTLMWWGALLACGAALLAPIWVGTIPPLTDFGGHLQLADAWATLGVDPHLATYLERRDTWLAPNLFSARVVGWLYPLFEPLAGLRIVVTLAMISVVAATAWALRVFGRSRWLIFLAMPALWGWVLSLGLVNYVFAVAGIVAALPIARRAALRGRWVDLLGLGALGVLAFSFHGIGYVFTVAMAVGVLVLSAPGWRRLASGIGVLAPSGALWGAWFATGRVSSAGPPGGLAGAVEDVYWGTATRKLEALLHYPNVTTSDLDHACFWVFALVWLALIGLSRGDGEDAPGEAGPWERVARWSRANTLLLVALALALGVRVLPVYVQTVAISERLVMPLFLVLATLPRLSPMALRSGRNLPAALAIAAAIALAIGANLALGAHLVEQTRRYDQHEIRPLVRTITRIPPGARARCFEVATVEPRFFHHRPIQHACDGLLQTVAGAYAGGGFAYTGYNAVKWRLNDWVQLPRDWMWRRWTDVNWWDWFVVRGAHQPPSDDVAELVHREEPAPGSEDTEWALYRVTRPEVRETIARFIAGGDGGHPAHWNCRAGEALTGLHIARDREQNRLVSITPGCRTLTAAHDDRPIHPEGAANRGPVLGGTGGHRDLLRCPAGEVVVGLHGRYDSMVEDLEVVCAVPGEPPVGPPWKPPSPDRGPKTLHMQCPGTSVATGVRARVGIAVDAAGIACTPLDAAVEQPEPEPEGREATSPRAGRRGDRR